MTRASLAHLLLPPAAAALCLLFSPLLAFSAPSLTSSAPCPQAALGRERAAQGQTLSVALRASMMEVYNEKVFDLLVDDPTEAPTSLDVRVAADGSASVPGLSLADSSSAADVCLLLERGAARRRTHATLMNAARVT